MNHSNSKAISILFCTFLVLNIAVTATNLFSQYNRNEGDAKPCGCKGKKAA